MKQRIDTTWELDPADTLSVCGYKDCHTDMVSLSNIGWPGFVIMLRPSHIPAIEELLRALIAKRDAATPKEGGA